MPTTTIKKMTSYSGFQYLAGLFRVVGGAVGSTSSGGVGQSTS